MKEFIFGDGKILVAPCIGNDDISGIGFSTQLGSGKVNEKHPTIKCGSILNADDYDVIFWFKNKESLKVLQWAVEEGLKNNTEPL